MNSKRKEERRCWWWWWWWWWKWWQQVNQVMNERLEQAGVLFCVKGQQVNSKKDELTRVCSDCCYFRLDEHRWKYERQSEVTVTCGFGSGGKLKRDTHSRCDDGDFRWTRRRQRKCRITANRRTKEDDPCETRVRLPSTNQRTKVIAGRSNIWSAEEAVGSSKKRTTEQGSVEGSGAEIETGSGRHANRHQATSRTTRKKVGCGGTNRLADQCGPYDLVKRVEGEVRASTHTHTHTHKEGREWRPKERSEWPDDWAQFAQLQFKCNVGHLVGMTKMHSGESTRWRCLFAHFLGFSFLFFF